MTYRLRNVVLAVALAGVAAVLTMFYVSNYKRSVQEGEANFPVYVATQDIPPGTSGNEAVARGLAEKIEVPKRAVVAGAISGPEQIDRLVATETIYAGEQISARRFRPPAQIGVRAQLAGNMRVVQVPGDSNQLLVGTLKRGDRVDIVASLKYKVGEVTGSADAGETERTASRVVLRDLLVLRAPVGSFAAERVGANVGAYAVQLAVTDSQAQKLFFVVKNGDWSLQLRPALDAADSPESVETIESVLGDGLRPEQLSQLTRGRDE